MRAVEHDRREARLDALVAALISAVIQMQGNRNCDLQFLDHRLHHVGNRFEAAHILSRALGNAEDNGRIQLLRGEQDGFCPLQIVDVELTDGIVTRLGFFQHFFCRYEHRFKPP